MTDRKRLIERIQMAVPPRAGEWAEVIADELLADGWMRPPFTIGQTVYAVDRRSELYWQGIVSSFYHTLNEFEVGVSFEDGDFAVYDEDAVFLTREEAEKALRGGGEE